MGRVTPSNGISRIEVHIHPGGQFEKGAGAEEILPAMM